MISKKRIPFEEAIEEKLLLKPRFQELSFAQRTALKILYGLDLSKRKINPDNGFSELDYWAIFNGFARLSDLGYPTEILSGCPLYTPQEYREGWFIFGRRAGKTDAVASTVDAYEALLGGHEEFLRPRQQGVIFQIAQDLRLARNSLHFIRAVIESSPLLQKEILNITADRIDLKNRFTIACVPASLKSVRGYASPISVLDEVGVWYQEAESANPDYEIYRALSPGQIQFPFRKIIGISSPWNKNGLLFQYYEAGTEGFKLQTPGMREQYKGVVVLKGPTAVMGNPQVQPDYLRKERAKNQLAFEREMLAEFQDSISGFIPGVLVAQSVTPGIFERPFDPRYQYYAAIDPAFRRDSFGLTIVHNEKGVIVQDVVRKWVPEAGTPMSPAAILDMLVPLLSSYKLTIVYSDQYHLESLGQLLRERGIEIFPITFTPKSKAQMFGNLQQLFLQKRIRLLDDFDTIKEVKSLERTLTSGGNVSISAPPGQHDDIASTLAVASSQAMFDLGEKETEEELEQKGGLAYHRLIQEQISRKWAAMGRTEDDGWAV